MKREHFVKVVEEMLDLLPQEFPIRIRNVVSPRSCRCRRFSWSMAR